MGGRDSGFPRPPITCLLQSYTHTGQLELGNLAAEVKGLPSVLPPTLLRGRGRVWSPWVSMTLHFGVLKIKPLAFLSLSAWSPLVPPRRRLERRLNCPGGVVHDHFHLPGALAGHFVNEQ